MIISLYSKALNYSVSDTPSIDQFNKRFGLFAKQLLDDLIKMQMLEIQNNKVLITQRGVNSLSIAKVNQFGIMHEPK